MQDPRAGVICRETDSHIVPSYASGNNIAANLRETQPKHLKLFDTINTYRIGVVIDRASGASDDIKRMLRRAGST
jgi:hypothetical protein